MPKRRAQTSKTKEPERRITRAGRKLKKLLERTGTGISTFAHNAGVGRITVHRLINGERWQHIDINVVLAICAEANGISPEDFASITATPVDEEADDEGPAGLGTGTDG